MSVSGTLILSRAILPFVEDVGGFLILTRQVGTTDETIELILDGAPAGLVGTLTVSIVRQDTGDIVYNPTAAGIIEIPMGTSRYVATVPLPPVGAYFVIWDAGTVIITVELVVLADAMASPPLHAVTADQYEAKVGDLQPPLIATLINGDGSPIDLTLAESVIIRVRQHNGPIVVERDAFVLDAEGGEVMLDWEDGEQDTPGTFDAEWEIAWPGDLMTTVPSRGYYRFRRYGSLETVPSNRWPGVA